MPLNPLAPVSDYQSMLNRIFWFTTAAALVATWILRTKIPALNLLLQQLDFPVAYGSDKILPLPGGYLLPALAVGLIVRIFRPHALISDWLGIRECFDVDVIIAEFADQLPIDLTATERDQVVAYRHPIMRQVFYPYVSGTLPHIDPQLIQQALDMWSWLWIGIEATVVFLLAAFGLIAYGIYTSGFQILGGTVAVAALSLPAIHSQCKRYAIAQVRAILSDRTRAETIRTTFAELIGVRSSHRRAA